MGRKKELPVLRNIKVSDIGAEGKAVAKLENQVIFIPMLIPGDVVDIQVRKKRKKYLEGTVIRFHEYSPYRVKPQCIHFGVCGGCKWQHLPYDLQLIHKEKQVIENLKRIGKVDIQGLRQIIGSEEPFFYRNKLEYTFSDKRWLTKEEISTDSEFSKDDALGFHIPGIFDKVLDIKECHLQNDPSNAIRDTIRRYAHRKGLSFFNIRQHSGFLRNLIIRNNSKGEFMVIMVFFLDEKQRIEGIMEFLANEFPCITSLLYFVNTKKNDSLADQVPILYKGKDYLVEEMDGLKFRIGPKSFYQTNTKQSLRLYNIAKEFAGLNGTETVYDLYTGTGTIANFMARSAGRVIGIEYIPEAVEDAITNSVMNHIDNTRFFAGDIRSVLNENFIKENGKPDIVITDPPRAGMHEDVVNAIIKSDPSKIVYVSCNPATQARDLSILSRNFRVTGVQPVDMFPQTHHVENVVLMEKNPL